jgi:hypothetical protein
MEGVKAVAEAAELSKKHGIDMLSAQLLILLAKAKRGEKITGLERLEASIQAGVDEFMRKIKVYTDTINDIRMYMDEEPSDPEHTDQNASPDRSNDS